MAQTNEGESTSVARATDTMRSDSTPSTEVSHEAASAITAHWERCVHDARRAAIPCLIALAITLVGFTWVRGSSFTELNVSAGTPRLPLWVPAVALIAAVYEFAIMVTRLNAARHDAESLARRPLRALTRPVILVRKRDPAERWLLLYATGRQPPPAPFAAVPCVVEWPVPASVLLVDVAGVPKKGRLLTVFDAATGRVLGLGDVPSTAKTVELMRQD